MRAGQAGAAGAPVRGDGRGRSPGRSCAWAKRRCSAARSAEPRSATSASRTDVCTTSVPTPGARRPGRDPAPERPAPATFRWHQPARRCQHRCRRARRRAGAGSTSWPAQATRAATAARRFSGRPPAANAARTSSGVPPRSARGGRRAVRHKPADRPRPRFLDVNVFRRNVGHGNRASRGGRRKNLANGGPDASRAEHQAGISSTARIHASSPRETKRAPAITKDASRQASFVFLATSAFGRAVIGPSSCQDGVRATSSADPSCCCQRPRGDGVAGGRGTGGLGFASSHACGRIVGLIALHTIGIHRRVRR